MSDLVKRPTSTRASDADRDRALQLLSEATSDGRLSVEEHHDLMTQTLHAKTLGELEVITTDLAPAATTHVVERAASKRGLLAVFGSRSRKGSWQVPTEFTATAIFGEVTLDFRHAQFDAPEVLCVANSIFGAVEVIVPDWVRVIDEGTAVFGAREESGTTSGTPTVTVHMKGLSAFGAVEIKHSAPKLKRGGGPELEPPTGA